MNMFCKVFLTQAFILTCFRTQLATTQSTPSRGRCYVKTPTEKIIEKCSVKYDIEGCLDRSQVRRKFKNEEDVDIFTKFLPSFSSVLNISITPRISEPRSIWVLINGESMREKRCVQICFPQVNREMTIHLDNLEIPNGDYNITGMGFVSSRGIFTKRKNINRLCENVINSTDVIELFHRSFKIESHIINVNRRDIHEKECSCSDCITSSHEYFKDSGLLRFYYNITKNSCTNFSIKLLKLVDASVNTEEKCLALYTNDYDVFKKMAAVGPTRSSDKSPVDFPNTPTGCYLIRTMQGVFHGFFWLEAQNLTEMDSWNTTIVLTTRSFDSSVEVSWASPEFPFNFTSWQLTLWYVKDAEVQCEGKNSESRIVETFEPQETILDTSSYLFTNMSEGFYCARIFPIDKRCPSDGCTPRSSKTVRLMSHQEPVEESGTSTQWIIYGTIALGVVVGIALAIFLFRYYKKSYKPRMTYTLVPMKSFQLDPLDVLVIWTKLYTEVNPEFENVVKAFKNLLRTYCNCSVTDYMDYGSLDWKERQKLLAYPTEWLQKHLQDKNFKIIFIGTQETKSKQIMNDEKTENGKAESDGNSEAQRDSLDYLLFPFALRFLNNSTELATDYARIFYIRFTGLHSVEKEFEDIVPWMRFSIPNHLRSLSLKLRGLSEESCESFPQPPENQISNLQTLIQNCNDKI